MGRRLILAALLLGLVAVPHDAVSVAPAGLPPAVRQAFDEYRPFRPRVTGGLTHVPWTHGTRLAVRAVAPPRARLALARSLRGWARDGADQERAAKLRVLSVHTEDVLAWLPAAPAHLSPEMLTDLAAAALISSELDDRPDRLVVALDLALRAADVRPGLSEAHHNAALAFEQLGLWSRAAAAWRRAEAAEPDAAWRREAREGLERAEAVPDRQVSLSAARAGGLTVEDVEADADVARDLLLRYILPRWPEARTGLGAAAAREAAAALAAGTGDREPLAALDHADRECAASAVRCGRAADAHRRHDAGVRAWEADRPGEAFADFDRVRRLVGGDHPLALSIELMQARREYYAGRFEAAAAGASAVARVAGRGGYLVIHGRALWLSGLVAHEQGAFDEALDRYRAARDLLAKARDRDGLTAVENLLAHYYALLEDDTRTWEHLTAATRGLAGSRPIRREPVLANAAIAASRARLPRAALAFLEQAAEETRALGAAASEVMALAGLAGGLSALGRHAEADAALREAGQRAAALPDEELRGVAEAVVAAASGEALAATRPTAALDALTHAIEFYGGRNSAFDLARLLHARGRLQLRQGRVVEAEADWRRGAESATAQHRALRSGVERARLRAVRWALLTSLADLVAARSGDPAQGLAILERARAEAEASEQDPLSDAWRGRLPDGWLLVVYAVQADGTLGWALDGSGLSLFRLPQGAAELQARVESFRRLLERREASDDARAAARELFDVLLGSVAAQVSAARRLVVVPDGALSALPFAALRDDQGFLVERRPVVMSPSLTHALGDDAPRPEGGVRALVIGNPAARQPGLPGLPGADREAQVVAALYPGAALLRGSDAARGRFLDELPKASILHFAGHARANLARPELSQLFLAPGSARSGEVFLREIESMRLDATRLVVLAACDSARAAPLDGEGVVGLARAFLGAGVPSVVATLWPIEDRQSHDLFVLFHRGIVEGLDPPEALRRAQGAVLASGPQAAIADWAAPVALGRAR